MELNKVLQSIMKEREEQFSVCTHSSIMRSVRVGVPLQKWAVRSYVVATSFLATFSLWNTLTIMADRQAFEFVQVAIDGLSLDLSVWPYFSSVFFDFIPGEWSVAFLVNGFLLIAGLFLFRRGRLHTLSF